MKKKVMNYVMTVLGILILGTGLLLVKTITDPQGIMKGLPYVCVGIGSGIFGSGIGNLISQKTMKKRPDLQKQIEINQKDERNIAIGNSAKAKAYDMMIYVFGALMLSYTLMDIDLLPMLLLVFAYLFVIFYGIYYRIKYEKER